MTSEGVASNRTLKPLEQFLSWHLSPWNTDMISCLVRESESVVREKEARVKKKRSSYESEQQKSTHHQMDKDSVSCI